MTERMVDPSLRASKQPPLWQPQQRLPPRGYPAEAREMYGRRLLPPALLHCARPRSSCVLQWPLTPRLVILQLLVFKLLLQVMATAPRGTRAADSQLNTDHLSDVRPDASGGCSDCICSAYGASGGCNNCVSPCQEASRGTSCCPQASTRFCKNAALKCCACCGGSPTTTTTTTTTTTPTTTNR